MFMTSAIQIARAVKGESLHTVQPGWIIVTHHSAWREFIVSARRLGAIQKNIARTVKANAPSK